MTSRHDLPHDLTRDDLHDLTRDDLMHPTTRPGTTSFAWRIGTLGLQRTYERSATRSHLPAPGQRNLLADPSGAQTIAAGYKAPP